jgi:hypothetical protein
MQLFNALDLKNGKKADVKRLGTITRPLQFLPVEEKDFEWSAMNIDWLEMEGMRQVRRKARRLLKNYSLAEGIIDKSDYVVDDNNEMSEVIEVLTRENDSPLELKFYPIIPNIIKVLLGEFAKRSSKLIFRAVDDTSYNEMMEQKRQMIEDTLLAQASQKQQMRLMQMGLAPDSQEFQQGMAPEKLKSLPEIESFFRKDYQSLVERWANVQTRVDEERFAMAELELTGFKDMLITDSEFWHFKMMEDDYEVELWNPVFTFFHKSPNVRYISQGNFAGKFDLLTVSDVIDSYGYLMNEEEMMRLQDIYPEKSAVYGLPGTQNDGGFYNATKSYEWNTNMPSLAMRQYNYNHDTTRYKGDILEDIMKSSNSDFFESGDHHLLRVTTGYWKSQRRIGHLTKQARSGIPIQTIVTEHYKVTDKPIYDTTVIKEKTKDNLVFGEHIDWFWINDVWGGIKIGANTATGATTINSGSIEPIYLGIDMPKPGRLKFQFKGDNSLYGCKLPVEGRVFNDRNTRSTGLVDTIKPFQVQYNLVNNQIADILVDELGTVIVLDQNAIPRHSMGEDWGRGNLSKAYVAMKDFGMLPLDTTITNTENAMNFNHWQVLNLEQTNRLLSRVNLSTHFKEQAYEVVGISPQRRGQSLGRQTAKGVEENLNASYAQTEIYFIQHCDQLMPRVHQMRTDLAQHYQGRENRSFRLQAMTSLDERVNFQMNGDQLPTRELNVYATTKTNHREIMRQLTQMAVQNNTSGSSIYDLSTVVKAESMAELDQALKAIDEKVMAMKQAEMQHEQDLENQRLEAEKAKHDAELAFEADEAQKNREKDITVAEIRAAGYGATMDINANQQSDYLDALDQIRKQDEFQSTMDMKREQETNKVQLTREQMNLKREELQTKEQIAQKQLQIARENKNKYDKPSTAKKK